MKHIFIAILCALTGGCGQQAPARQRPAQHIDGSRIDTNYTEVTNKIALQRKQLKAKYPNAQPLTNKESLAAITDVWVSAIGNDLFKQWQGTPWDFNGTVSAPHAGNIACGYFVTTLLRDMGVKIDRIKLAICASSVMMTTLVPDQKLKNLSSLSYDTFNSELTKLGKGVYIVGLDFHTGFIVNDGTQNWFIHSNYVGRRGVTKELVLQSAALRASKTRWLVSLTGDKGFLLAWMNGKKL